MRRREFLGWLCCSMPALAIEASAEQAHRSFRIGVLDWTGAEQNAGNLGALRAGLAKLGYIEGRNLTILYRSADGRADAFPRLASELVAANVDLIVTRGTPAVQAVKQASNTMPVVMAAMGAPFLVVDSLSHPGGTVTGLTTFSNELIGKRIELLKEVVPGLARVGLLQNLRNPMSPPEWVEAKVAARALSLEPLLFDVASAQDLDRAFDQAKGRRVDGLIVGADGITEANRDRIVALCARHRLPASHPSRQFVESGGLMAYAVRYPDLYFRAASFVDKILRGAKPADLPVEQPSRYELVINLKTATALGIKVPQSVVLRADSVID